MLRLAQNYGLILYGLKKWYLGKIEVLKIDIYL